MPRALAGRLREERLCRRLAGAHAALSWSAARAASSRTTTPRPIRRNGRKYLDFADGTRSYFPTRAARRRSSSRSTTQIPNDQYARLYRRRDVVDAINRLDLPRYGLGNYLRRLDPSKPPTPDEAKSIWRPVPRRQAADGFCRTNLFKRLESSGHAFILSVERHILRNFIFLHAIENDLPIPIGTQDMGLLDTRANDEDADLWDPATPTMTTIQR